MAAVWINGKTLEWNHLWDHLGMWKDKKRGKWFVSDSNKTPDSVTEFLMDFGYLHNDIFGFEHTGLNASQLAVITLNTGFAKFLVEHEPSIAIEIGIATEQESES